MNGSLDATMNLDESLAAAQAKLSMAQVYGKPAPTLLLRVCVIGRRRMQRKGRREEREERAERREEGRCTRGPCGCAIRNAARASFLA